MIAKTVIIKDIQEKKHTKIVIKSLIIILFGEKGGGNTERCSVLLIFVIFRIFSNENMFQTKTKINYFPVDNSSVTKRWKEQKKSMA